MTHVNMEVECQPDGNVCLYTNTSLDRIVSILRFYSAIILQSPFHRNIFIQTKGPKLISLLLQQMDAQCLSTGIFDAIHDLKQVL
jgi:hypothetical protein